MESLRSRSASFAAAVALVCALGYVDSRIGFEISLGLFYVVPIALATWRTGLYAGLFLAVVTVISMFLVDSLLTRDLPLPSHDLIPYWNTGIRLGYFIVIVATLAALKRAHDRERRRAREDFLTGIANSQAFTERARIEIGRTSRYNHPTSIAYMDCDNFKDVNDRYGHAGGDAVLRAVAVTLRQRLRGSDVVARLGGDEFGILLPETAAHEATAVIAHVRAELLDSMRLNGWPVTFSIGVVTFAAAPDTFEEALQLADTLMYAIKKDGKNTVRHQVFDGDEPRQTSPAPL